MDAGSRSRAGAALLLGLVAGCGSVGALAIPEPREHPERTADFDVEHYALALELDPTTRTIAATARVRGAALADGLAELRLDLVDLRVAAVRGEHGEPLAFRHADGVLAIALARPLARGEFVECTVEYGGAPRRGLYFEDHEQGVATQVFTQGECEDSRGWFPCLDFPSERATSEVAVTLPAGWTSLAAGERVERRELADGRALERWRMATPHPAYLTTLVAGDFVVREGAWDGIPLVYLADPTLAPWMDARFAETPRVLEFFSELTGVRYPYPKYGQACVANFMLGGMENISATTLTDAWLVDERGSRDIPAAPLLAHEAAHQWFGNLLTCRHWSHIWLNEGWATYGAELYGEATLGREAFECAMAELREGFLALDTGAARRPMLSAVYRDPMDLFTTGHAYPGGACRLHQLRFELGDDAFFAGVRRWFADHRGRAVTTDDFRKSLELATGRDLGPFFEQWFHASGHPELFVRWEWDEDAREVRVDVEQTHAHGDGTPAAFRMEAELELVPRDAGAEPRVERVTLAQRSDTFTLAADERPRAVLLDPRGWLLARISSERSTSEWVALAERSPHPLVRREAVRTLGTAAREARDERSRALYVEVIEARLLGDPQGAVRHAAARALAPLAPAFGRAAFLSAASGDAEARVRVACLEALGAFPIDAEIAQLAREQLDAGFSWATMAAAARLDLRGQLMEGSDVLATPWDRDSPHELLRSGALAALGGENDLADALLLRTFQRTASPRVREALVRALVPVARRDGELRQAIEGLLFDPDYRLRGAAIDALGQIQDLRSLRALRRAYPTLVDSRQRRAVEAILRAPWAVRGP